MYLFEYFLYRDNHKKQKKEPGFLKRHAIEWLTRLVARLNIKPSEFSPEDIKKAEEDRLKQEAEEAKTKEDERKILAQANTIRAVGVEGEFYPLYKSISDTPKAKGVLYAQNDRYLDICTPYNNMRGLITIATVVFAMLFIMQTIFGTAKLLEDIFFSDFNIFWRLFFFFFLLLTIPFTIFYYYVFKYFSRLEIFVQRRLIVRFDRVHRKVYLHRPGYLGGVMTQDWDKLIVAGIEPHADIRNEVPSILESIVSLTLTWYGHESSTGLTESTTVGKSAADNPADMSNLWEFIRRFMEEGPQSVPREKPLGKIPWPWQSLIATFGGFSFLRKTRFGAMQMGFILMIPAFLFMAFVRWFSLLLCWEPVYPRRIRKACGEPFTAVLKARCVDLVAWSMLAGVLWWWWPTLSTMFPLHVFEGVVDYVETNRGKPEAQYTLGLKYKEGQGVAQNDERAAKLLHKAAEQGYVEAQYKLGLMYSKGDGVERKYWEATKWYSEAAEQGHAEAQYEMGRYYEEGGKDGQGEVKPRLKFEIPPELYPYTYRRIQGYKEEAKEWYHKAAEQGHLQAQYKLGEVYYQEGQIRRSYEIFEEAAKWYRKAAERGHADAQYKLGKMHHHYQQGVEQNFEEATTWFLKAAEQGHEGADSELWKYLIFFEAPENDPERSEWFSKNRKGSLPKSGSEREALLNKIRAVVQERIAAKKNTKKPE
jgi:TPR repeat protein